MSHPSPSIPAHRAFLPSGEGENWSLGSHLVLILELLCVTIAQWQPCRVMPYHLYKLPIIHPPGWVFTWGAKAEWEPWVGKWGGVQLLGMLKPQLPTANFQYFFLLAITK